MGIGDGGFGDWGLGIGPNPQSPIPNPQSPFPFFNIEFNIFTKKKKNKKTNKLYLFNKKEI